MGSQLAGKLNIFVTTAIAAAFFGDVLTPGEVSGGIVALAGLAVYEKAHKKGNTQKTNDLGLSSDTKVSAYAASCDAIPVASEQLESIKSAPALRGSHLLCNSTPPRPMLER